MKKQVVEVQKSEFKTVSVTKEVEQWVAEDGTVFNDENKCIKYEEFLAARSNLGDNFKIIDSFADPLVKLWFEAYGDLSDVQLCKFIFNGKDSYRDIEKCLSYFDVKSYNALRADVWYLAASWTSDWHTDYPSWGSEVIPLSKAIEQVKEVLNELEK